jgi:hypothetical protein
MALIDKPELVDSERRILALALDTPGFRAVLEKIGQREVIKAMQRQQSALRNREEFPFVCMLAGRIEVWEGLLQCLVSESRSKPGV